MDYKAVVTRDAEEDLERFIKYLIIEKESMQAAENVLNDYDILVVVQRDKYGIERTIRQCIEIKKIDFRGVKTFFLDFPPFPC